MLESALLNDIRGSLFYEVNGGYESTIFMDEYDNYTKIYNNNVPCRLRHLKEHILKSLDLAKIYEKYNLIPEIYKLIYTSDETLAGYSMGPVAGTTLDEFCKKQSQENCILLFKNLQDAIMIINNNGFCLTDFKPQNFTVTNDLIITLLDVDSFCLMNESVKHILCDGRYICPFTKIINTRHNIYSFYYLFIEMFFKVDLEKIKKLEVVKKITKEALLPDSIKIRLLRFLNIRSKKDLSKLNYLF